MIPSADGTYSFDVVATDYTGNQGKKTIWLVVNNSSTPQVEVDTYPPVVGTINPTSITIGNPVTLSAAVSDDTKVMSCQLYIDGALIGNMSGTPVKSGAVTYDYNFTIVGTYKAFASCMDKANRTTNGTEVDITVNPAPVPHVGGPGTGGTPHVVSGSLAVTATEKVNVEAGKTGTVIVQIKNIGSMTLTGVSLEVAGVPANWVTITPGADNIDPNASTTVTIVISVPASEPTESKGLVIKVRTKENYAAEANTALEITNPNTKCSCPAATDWSDCTNGNQTRTNYICDVTTNWTCKSLEESRTCTVQPPGPGGITGAILGFIENPTALGGSILAILVAAYAVWTVKKKGKEPKERVKTGI
jgi:hypothetical protein